MSGSSPRLRPLSLRVRPLRLVLVTLAIVSLTVSVSVALTDGPDDGKLRYLEQVADETPAWAAELDTTAAECVDGMAGPFPCDDVDLAGFVPTAQLGGPTGNDVWGWVDPETDREYAIAGTSAGTAFVDVTDPTSPRVVGTMPSQSLVGLPLWRDIKVHDDHAFVVSEHDGHGMQVFDLTRLRGEDPLGVGVDELGTVFTPDAWYTGEEGDPLSNTHNVWIDEVSGYAYLVGTNTCDGGLHMVDVSEPLEPTFAGCFAEDGYTHDVECAPYDGPDRAHRGREICIASNEDTVTIVDVTDKSDPQMISRTGYPEAAYTHQGALTPDGDWFLFNDELDEQSGTVDNTTTYIMDVGDLDAPGAPVGWAHETQTIDHNLYVDDRFVYQANYNEGLRILEWSDELLSDGQLEEVAYFDVVPGVDVSEFAGAWSNYDFPSGTVVVNTIESGLFVLQPDLPDDGDDGDGSPSDRPECRERRGSGQGPERCRT